MFGTTTVKQALKVDINISSAMVSALQTWIQMYVNQASWLNTEVKSMNLPAAIAGEIARAVTIEMKVEITGSARADYLHAQIQKILPRLRQVVEYGNAKGGLVLKPFPQNGGLPFDFVQADQFYPVSFDANLNMPACVFADQRKIGDNWYTRLEHHSFVGGVCVIRNVAFKSSSQDSLGSEVSLSAVPDWAMLAPEATIRNITAPLYGYFRYPLANNIDPASPLGVACYARAVDLIQQADEQWSRFLWEMVSGDRALYADVSAFDKNTTTGNPELPKTFRRLYRTLHQMNKPAIGEEGFFKEWSPTLRQKDQLEALDAILKKIEFECGLAYGTISDPESIEKTATEIIASKQRSQATVVDAQKALQNALDQAIYAMDVYATLYNLAPAGTYTVTYHFDDSIVTDYERQFSQDQQIVGMGAMSKTRFLVRNRGLDEATAAKWVLEAQAEIVPQDNTFPNE